MWWSAGQPLAEFSRQNFRGTSALQESGRTKGLFFGQQSSRSLRLSSMYVALCLVLRQRLRCPSHSMRSSLLLLSFPWQLSSGGTIIPLTSDTSLNGTSLSFASGVAQLASTTFLAALFPDFEHANQGESA